MAAGLKDGAGLVRVPKRSSEEFEGTPLRQAKKAVGFIVSGPFLMGLEVQEEH